jgi:phage-related baseplate assembly protein
VPFKSLEDDQSLMKRIKEYVKSFKSEGQTVSFSVHGTSFEGLMVLCEAFTPVVQPLV